MMPLPIPTSVPAKSLEKASIGGVYLSIPDQPRVMTAQERLTGACEAQLNSTSTPAHERPEMAIVPTLSGFRGRWSWDILDGVRTCARQGGTILFGTDVGYLPHVDRAGEYELMASASPLDNGFPSR